jgi:uncharacterized Zn finger protein
VPHHLSCDVLLACDGKWQQTDCNRGQVVRYKRRSYTYPQRCEHLRPPETFHQLQRHPHSAAPDARAVTCQTIAGMYDEPSIGRVSVNQEVNRSRVVWLMLPRGRTYLRNGSVIDLKIEAGEVVAQVMGSSLYHIKVKISAVPAAHWQSISRDCAQSIDSWVELLQGQLSTAVMERIARPGAGLFPSPKEITFSCSCPDAAAMCKHVAATLYGIGSRLDAEPELLFRLRKVDAKELVARAGEGGFPIQQRPAASRILDSSKLAAVFGLDLVPLEVQTPTAGKVARKSAKQSSRQAAESTVTARKNKKKKGATARRQARL